MTDVSGKVLAVLTAIVGLAILSVLVSKGAQTPNVISSFGTAFSNIIKAAVGPVMGTGGLSTPSLSPNDVSSYFNGAGLLG